MVEVEDTGYGNAMTEIALALAMAFFSIMVLTMISMGVGEGKTDPAVGAVMAPAQTDTAPAAQVSQEKDDRIVIYFAGRYMDKDLAALDPASLHTNSRVILALDPALPVGEALAARGGINVENLVVSVLDERWLNRLKGLSDD